MRAAWYILLRGLVLLYIVLLALHELSSWYNAHYVTSRRDDLAWWETVSYYFGRL